MITLLYIMKSDNALREVLVPRFCVMLFTVK